ncbi:MAG: 4-hydroxy-tetrahydrodipicolinate synthase [Bacteroidota bacterium]
MANTFKGTGVALVTPFKDGQVDYNALEKVVEHCIAGGLEFLVSLGTTGESVTLSKEEKLKVLNVTAEIAHTRIPLVAGFGGNNTQAIIDSINSFDFKQYDGILSVVPAYNKPTQEGIYQHFKAIGAVAPRPVILYNVPGRTSKNMTAETTLRLAHENSIFCAVKEASGDLVQVMKIVKDRPKGFLVLSGDDVLTLPMLSFGADGVISVIANALPQQYSDMVRLGLSGNFEAAGKAHLELIELIDLLFVDGNPAGVKAALEILGVSSVGLRLPLVPVTPATYTAIEKQLAGLGI